jgi:hypothetical protein
MRLLLFIFFIFPIFGGGIYAQKNKISFQEQKNQNSFNYQPFVSFSYSYAHKFSPKLTLGISAQVGLGLRFLLSSPNGYYICDQCPPGSGLAYSQVSSYTRFFFDVWKVQTFYRFNNIKHFYFDVGPYVTYAFQGSEFSSEGLTTGIEGSAFYSVSKFHIGTSIMAGVQFMNYNNVFKINFFGLLELTFNTVYWDPL